MVNALVSWSQKKLTVDGATSSVLTAFYRTRPLTARRAGVVCTSLQGANGHLITSINCPVCQENWSDVGVEQSPRVVVECVY